MVLVKIIILIKVTIRVLLWKESLLDMADSSIRMATIMKEILSMVEPMEPAYTKIRK